MPKADRHGQRLVNYRHTRVHGVQGFPIRKFAEPHRFQYGDKPAICKQDSLKKKSSQDGEADKVYSCGRQ